MPSLIALRAFEAAGRHECFTKAAQELSVTQSAVSRQIKLLEDQLGIKVFDRTAETSNSRAKAERCTLLSWMPLGVWKTALKPHVVQKVQAL